MPKQKATAKAVAFCFGFRRLEANAQGGEAAHLRCAVRLQLIYV